MNWTGLDNTFKKVTIKSMGLADATFGKNFRGTEFGMVAKEMFFSSQKVKDAMDQATYNVLINFGAYVRRRARSSLKPKPYGVYSAPGSPPYSHVTYYQNRARRAAKKAGQTPGPRGFEGLRYLHFGYDTYRRSVVIGPATNRPRIPTTPEILENGGMSKGTQARTITFEVGDFGPIEVGKGGWTSTPTGRMQVHRVPLKTQRQVARANQLQAQYHFGSRKKTKIAARPFMGPAFEIEKRENLSKLWLDSVRA